MRCYIVIVISLFFLNSLSSKQGMANYGHSSTFKPSRQDRIYKNVKTFKSKSAKKTGVAVKKHKRSKVKGLKTSQPIVTGTEALITFKHVYSDDFDFIPSDYNSVLYCVNYQRGPPQHHTTSSSGR